MKAGYTSRQGRTREESSERPRRRRFRKRFSTLLHTHVALILVSTLAALDASCVIGQIICDILIMKEQLHEWHVLDENLTQVLVHMLPALNGTSVKDLKGIFEILESASSSSSSSEPYPHHGAALPLLTRHRRAAPAVGLDGESAHYAGGHEEHGLLHELTHAFHLGSMAILSLLLLETLCKVFAMGKKILHHKLEVFDAFVVTTSWCLDVAFWEGIWAHPGTEAATILIFILPWRVVRIVNSFVLVIQEKDHVQLKIVKQRLRSSTKKSKEIADKVNSYKVEVKQLQGLARKHGATEGEINACGPGGRRRRSSVKPVLDRVASLTMLHALGSLPSLSLTMDSSSDEEDERSNRACRTVSLDPSVATMSTLSSGGSLSDIYTIDGAVVPDTSGGQDNPVFEDEQTEDKLPSYEEVQQGDIYTHL